MIQEDLYVHDSGEGEAVVFLHAFPLDASQWDHQVAGMSGRWRCLRPDFWGCGLSPLPAGEVSLADYAQAVLGALDARDISSFSLVGLSMGGYAAFEMWRLA